MMFDILSNEALLIRVTVSSNHWVPKDALQPQCQVTNSNDTVPNMHQTAGVMSILWKGMSRHAALHGVCAMSTYRRQWALGTIQFLLDTVDLLLQVPPSDVCIMCYGMASGTQGNGI